MEPIPFGKEHRARSSLMFNVVDDFNRTYREELLNCYAFETGGELRRMAGLPVTARWRLVRAGRAERWPR